MFSMTLGEHLTFFMSLKSDKTGAEAEEEIKQCVQLHHPFQNYFHLSSSKISVGLYLVEFTAMFKTGFFSQITDGTKPGQIQGCEGHRPFWRSKKKVIRGDGLHRWIKNHCSG